MGRDFSRRRLTFQFFFSWTSIDQNRTRRIHRREANCIIFYRAFSKLILIYPKIRVAIKVLDSKPNDLHPKKCTKVFENLKKNLKFKGIKFKKLISNTIAASSHQLSMSILMKVIRWFSIKVFPHFFVQQQNRTVND